MMKSFRHITLSLALAVSACLGLMSCDKYNYTDQLQQLGSRVEYLEQSVLETNMAVTALHEIILAIEQRGYVTNVVTNADGTYTITFNTGRTVTLRNGRQGRDGRDGTAATLDISVAQDPSDGQWYWTLGGQWLLNGNGDRMPAGALDGKDGKDGRDGNAGYVVVPQVRINPDTRHWEISTDGSRTWTDTGVVADGRDGQDGQDGQDGRDGANGRDDMFLQIVVSDDGQSITFILGDGRTFTVPIETAA